MKLSSLEMLDAVIAGDGDAVYAAFCKHFDIMPASRVFVDIYPAVSATKYAVLWQDGYVYSWKLNAGWEIPIPTDLDTNELLIRS